MVLEISDDEDFFDDPLFKQPKDENLYCDIPPANIHLRAEENVASSSGTNLRSSFIGMGFAPSLIDRAIEEKGEDNAELLLETLFAYSELASAESLDRPSCLGAKKILDGDGYLQPKEEPDVCSLVDDNKTNTLLKMNFTLEEVQFALNKLGNSASIHKLMDYIFASRMANKYGKDANNPFPVDEDIKEDSNAEDLFGIMEKTLQLLEMGFTENDISVAFERCGSEAPLQELAESIVLGDKYVKAPNISSTLKRKIGDNFDTHTSDSIRVKTEGYSFFDAPQANVSELLKKSKAKIPKEEPIVADSSNLKTPKMEFDQGPSNSIGRMRQIGRVETVERDWKPSTTLSSNKSRVLPSLVSKPPYFFYGDVTNLSQSSWVKISQFLYSVQPEIVNTQAFSALNRSEGYIHNLPCEDRFPISPKSPTTIQEALPRSANKWWPEWDKRKHLSYVNCDISGVAQMCERLCRAMIRCNGCLATNQERDFVDKCVAKSLVWVGNQKVGPIEPEILEPIMGYRADHTRVGGSTPAERLRLLKNSFQTDTLGYHLSVLRRLFPGGLTLLSFFSGIGGAEVALHRLGIPLKGVVSVEPCETKRRVLKQWWSNTGQSGKLIQIENVHSLSGNKLQDLIKQFGAFDVVMCQNPSSDGHREEDGPTVVDFTTFAEFVRVTQRVRSSYG